METLVNLELCLVYRWISQIGFHSNREFLCYIGIIIEAPSLCWSSFLPDHKILSQFARVLFPLPVLPASAILRSSRYKCISWRACGAFSVWFSILTFQQLIVTMSFWGERRSAVRLGTSLRLWSLTIITPVTWSASLVSVTKSLFYELLVHCPTPNNPEDQRTTLSLISTP